jgi:hypothetical protein
MCEQNRKYVDSSALAVQGYGKSIHCNTTALGRFGSKIKALEPM